MEAAKEYNVHLDNKKRVTLRGALYHIITLRNMKMGVLC